MNNIDQYIIKQFLKSFLFMFLLFIPIGILVDVSEKIDKFKEHDLGFNDVFNYYLDFIWYYGYFLISNFCQNVSEIADNLQKTLEFGKIS